MRIGCTRQWVATVLLATAITTAARAGVIAYWGFDASGLSSAPEERGGQDGTLVGNPQVVEGRIGPGLCFDGDNDCIRVRHDPVFNLRGTITVAAWIKPEPFKRAFATIIAKGDSTWGIARDASRDVLQFAANSENDMWVVRGAQNVNDGQWHHVAGVYDGRKMYLYVDGILDVSQDASGKIAVNDYPVCIGENLQSRERYFEGLIDDVAVFNHALDANAIAVLHTRGSACFLTETRMDRLVKEAEQAVATLKAADAVEVLSRRISEYEQWRQDYQQAIVFRDKYISPDTYFLLAQAKEAAAAPVSETSAAYAQVVRQVPYRTRHVGEALVWLEASSTSSHVTPSLERRAAKQLPRRVSRTQCGSGMLLRGV